MSADVTTVPIAPEQQALRARSLARDGWLFLGLGWLAIIVPLAGLMLSRNLDVNLAVMGMGVAAFCGLSLAGLYKLVLARRAGDGAANSWRAGAVIGVYVVAGYFICVAALMPRLFAMGGYGEMPMLCWAIPSLLLSIVVVCIARRERPGQSLTERRCAGSIIVAWIAVTCALGMIAEANLEWLIHGRFGAYIIAAMYAPEKPWGYYNKQLLMRGNLLTGIGLASALGLFAYVMTLVRLWVMCRIQRRPAVSVLPAAWMFLLPLCVLTTCVLAPTEAAYVGIVTAVLCLGAAGLVGAWFAHVWRPNVSRLRFYGAAIPVAAVLLACVPLTATIVVCGQNYYSSFAYGPFEPDWTALEPEALRSPIALELTRFSTDIENYVYSTGLASTEALRARALNTARAFRDIHYVDIWSRWWEHDPRATLGAALNVPTTVGAPSISACNYDFGAGYIVGQHADDADIRARFAGNYSDALVAGAILGLGPIRASRYNTEIIGVLNTRTFDDRMYQWLEWRAPAQVLEFACQLLRAQPSPQTPQTYALIEREMQSYHRVSFQFKLEALSSSDPVVRKLALNNSSSQAREMLWKVLACAEGATPHCDADERRMAADTLKNQLNLPASGVNVVYFDVRTRTPPKPLTDSELKAIDEICARARRTLPHWRGQ